MKRLIMTVLMVLMVSGLPVHISAQTHDMEFTPGPRMIRVIEQVAGSYVHLGLGLTPQQKEAMAGLVHKIKTEMWMKEAVLVGMFQELEEKRRHGLLQDNEYRSANALTGGIETDELNLFIETLAGLRSVLTAEQQAKVRAVSHSPVAFRISQGFNTKIGLMSMESVGRVYNGYRRELRLTDEQAASILSLLEAGRREVLRMGTEIDLSRVEADELVMRPDVTPEVIRAKMQKTGETEGVLFGKLFEVSDRIEALLTPDQRTTLAELKRARARQMTNKERDSHRGSGHGEGAGHQGGPRGFDYFLDQSGQLGLSGEQIAALVAAKNETGKTLLIDQAKLKGAELNLLTLLRGQEGETPVSDEQISVAVRGLEEIRSKITHTKALGYLKARRLLTREQQQHVHPPQTLEDGR